MLFGLIRGLKILFFLVDIFGYFVFGWVGGEVFVGVGFDIVLLFGLLGVLGIMVKILLEKNFVMVRVIKDF